LKESLTVLIGAGASLDLGGASVNHLTDTLLKKQSIYGIHHPHNFNHTKHIFKFLHDGLKTYYKAPNFEHILHALETISSLTAAWQNSTADQFKMIEGFLCSGPQGGYHYLFDSLLMINAKSILFETIHDEIMKTSATVNSHPNFAAWHQFWAHVQVAFDLNVATLNYDTFIDQALSGMEEGFVQVPGEIFSRFDPNQLLGAKNRIMHLHGSIHYGHLPGDQMAGQLGRIDAWEDLYYYPIPADAQATFGGRSTRYNQAGKESIVGPLITGMDKTSKILSAYPYSTTYMLLNEAIRTSSRLLIIGYGFADEHINNAIARMVRQHGTNRKIVIIDWYALRNMKWYPDSVRETRPALLEMVQLLGQGGTMNGFKYTNPMTSADGCLQIYLEGTHEALSNHGSNIIQFLS
jgi:hypothetical protein